MEGQRRVIQDAIDWLNNNAGAVQAVAVLVLAGVTYFYMRSTGKMANSASEQAEAVKQQADASVKMAEEMSQQRIYEGKPVLDIKRIVPPDDPSSQWEYDQQNHAWYVVRNIGRGAAINIYANVVNEAPDHSMREALGALGPGDETRRLAIAEMDGFVTVEYMDALDTPFRSRRMFSPETDGPTLGLLLVDSP